MQNGLSGYLQSILNTFRGRKSRPLPFERLFELFRLVLAGNNKAIELITDMGDTLGGDYLFDITYIRRVYAGLSEAIRGSLMNFEELTLQRYSGLPASFTRIDRQIWRMICDQGPSDADPVLFYEDISWDMTSSVGGKNAHLAEVKNNLKLPIPEAFVITVRAFEELIELNDLDGKIGLIGNDSLIPDADTGELYERILHAELPPSVSHAIDMAMDRIKTRCSEACFLSVRSSAEEEDGEYSFAGQFETILNVPLEINAVKDAYKKVVASLFSPRSIAYQKLVGMIPGRLKMAVGCMLMIDPVSSGVVYTAQPSDDRNALLIVAAWGLGTSVVDGSVDADHYVVEKTEDLEIMEKKIGTKASMFVTLASGGIAQTETPVEMRARPCLTAAQIRELAILSMQIEQYYRKSQDIEWAIDSSGKLFILQSRPLRMQKSVKARSADMVPHEEQILMKDRGTAVQRGVGSGRVFVLHHMDDLARFPKGAVLVSKYDSSNFIRVMPYASAILTDTGTSASHMASLCREFRIPTAVNTKDATAVLRHGQEVTVAIDDEGRMTVYDSIIRELRGDGYQDPAQMEDIYEYRKKKYILKHIAPLNLIDPLQDNFTIEGCKTLHDILRFMHEKSVMELVEKARYGCMVARHAAVRLDLPIPAGIIVIDIGGGLSSSGNTEGISLDQVASEPLRGIIRGMIYPGIWRSEAVALKAHDFLSSMMRMPDITADNAELVGYNIAVVSRQYVNLSVRFGYHFSTIDCYCSDIDRNNHIYFRFSGGATDITKRSRRIQLIADILKEYGFNINTKGDIVICRLSNLGKGQIMTILDQLGRLLSYTRQLDAVLHNDSAVRHYTDKFLTGDYTV
ncbi:MAG: hypothetical protein HZA15_03980 [Nitrospirae bacterium]|nr:hypothetical protein [Nitrospirota bacterium]